MSPAPARGRRSALPTREEVLRAALVILDADGLDGLSMRRLGQALNRDPMSLYRYAATKSALLDGVVELVLSELTVEAANPDWPAELRHVGQCFSELALAHPHVVPLLVTRPLSTPLALRPLGTLRPIEDLLELLIRAGFAEPDALSGVRLFLGFCYGHALHALQELVDNPEEADDVLRLGLHRLPLRQFPRLRSLASVLAGYDAGAELEVGLDIVIGGLQARLPPTVTGTRAPRGRRAQSAALALPPQRPHEPAGDTRSPRSSTGT